MKTAVIFFSFLLILGILITILSFVRFEGNVGADSSVLTAFLSNFGFNVTKVDKSPKAAEKDIKILNSPSLIGENVSEFSEGISNVSDKHSNLDILPSKDTSHLPNQLNLLPSVGPCPYDFKVYVYEIPGDLPSVRFGREARINATLHVCQKCMLEQFALEYIVSDFFTQFCGRTLDPSEADYYYLPLIRDAEYRVSIDTKRSDKRQPSLTEEAILDILEKSESSKWMKLFNITDKFWRARGGSDHIIAMPAPVTNLRHETGQRGFFHYMSHLHTPIFLGVEYSLSFVKEYPICSNQKNIVMPYPTTDPDLYSGKLFSSSINRTALLYYAGGMHGDCLEVRRAMKFMMLNSSALPDVLPHVKTIQAEREHGFRAATFCPIPVGDSPSSKRMYDVVNFGCIPIVLSDDLVWAFTHQTGGSIDHSSFSIQMPQAVVQFSADLLLRKYNDSQSLMGKLSDGTLLYDLLKISHAGGGSWYRGSYVNSLVQILQMIPRKNVEILRTGMAIAAPKFRYYAMDPSMKRIPTASNVFPRGGAVKMLALQLSQRKAVGLDKISSQCQAERGRKHNYINRFPCDHSLSISNEVHA